MSDNGAPDYRTPSPDAGHEAIRAPLAQAIDDLSAAVAQQQVHDDQLDSALRLCQGAFSFAETVLVNFQSLQQTVTDQAATISNLQTTVTCQGDEITTLQSQVAALQNPTPAA